MRIGPSPLPSLLLRFFYPPTGLDANYRVEFLKGPVSRPRGTRGRRREGGREDDSWRAMRGFNRTNSEPGFSDEDSERLRNFIRRDFVLITQRERERERERSCLFAKQVEVFRSVKWTEIITSVTSLDENKHIIVESY